MAGNAREMTAAARPQFGRPVGEVRQVIVSTLREHGPMAVRDLAQSTQVGYLAAARTVDNALRSGALQIVGHEKQAHCKKWVALYDVAEPAEVAQPAAEEPAQSWGGLQQWVAVWANK